ncbi:hypothetical protein U2P60_00995 [Brucella sp. H1_1004]|uniref:hypothetical protein n=1 Tax=Brucella sp. H1_1004 TaxID=3110109 RepID=UPI0039B50567
MALANEAWFLRIKSAQRDLIKYCGGIERVSEITSISKSQVGRWNNTTDTDLMPLNAVYMLERECGVPVVTTAMAALNGRRLADPDDDVRATGNLLAAHSSVMRNASELMSVSAQAFADGKVTHAEATQMDRVSSNLERSVTDLRSSISHQMANAKRGDPSLRIVGDE